MEPADHADEDCDYQAGPVDRERATPRNLGGFRRAGREARGEALYFCRGRTNTVSVYSKPHTGWLGSAKNQAF